MTRRICDAAPLNSSDVHTKVSLADLNALRDWGYAAKHLRALRHMLQQERLEELVIGTGMTHSVLEPVQTAFGLLSPDWRQHLERAVAQERPADTNDLRRQVKHALSLANDRPRDLEDLGGAMLKAEISRACGTSAPPDRVKLTVLVT